MRWIKRFFERKEKNNEGNQIELGQQIQTSIKKREQERSLNYNQIDQIKRWASGLLHEVFKIPTVFWYEELNNYNKIVKLEINRETPNHIVRETNDIIKGYSAQIRLRRKKIELCNLSIEKYKKLLGNYELTEKRLENFSNYKHLQDEFEKHNNILQNLDAQDHVKTNYELDLIESDVKQLEEELEIQKEIQNQIDILQQKYGLKNDYLNAEVFTSEINKIINKINHINHD